MDFAFLLVLVGSVALAVVTVVVRTWSLHQRIYSLEDRVGVVEGVQTREVKIRAAQSRTPKAHSDELLLAQLQTNPTRKRNWWENPNLPVTQNTSKG